MGDQGDAPPKAATGPDLYSEIGKKARDLQYKDFSTDQKSTLTTYAANGAAELPGTDMEKQIEEFIKNFYGKMHDNPEALYLLYDQGAELVWSMNGERLTMKTAQDIKSHLADGSIMAIEFHVGSFVAQFNRKLDIIFLVVNGICKGADNNTRNFVESFLLHKEQSGFLILNESLFVLENVVQKKSVSNIALSKDTSLTDVAPAEGNKSNEEILRKSKVCILHDDRMKLHNSKKTQNDVPSRITKILKRLQVDGVLERVERLEVKLPNRQDLLSVHTEEYLEYVDNLPLESKGRAKYKQFIGASLFSSPGTSEAAYLAAGAMIQACHVVAEGSFEKAFAIIRPPGHHAQPSLADGFCYLNNVAIGAKYLLNNFGMQKILVVDYDVHHGNGVQDIFYDSDNVLYFSTHSAALLYPDSNKDEFQIGVGIGSGFNVNVPLSEGFGDEDLWYVWERLLIPLVGEFSPDMILVAAGYDAAVNDPLGKCKVSPKGFGTIVNKLLPFANGKMVFGLEGGYNLTQLPICVSYTIRSLLGDREVLFDDEELAQFAPDQDTIDVVKRVKVVLRKHWEVFREQP